MGNPVQQWNYAARIALALARHPSWHESTAWGPYWREHLGRTNGSTFLMECHPFPRKGRSVALPGGCPWRPEEIWPRRREILRRHLRQHPPKIVVAYGKETGSKAEEVFDLTGWRPVSGVRHVAHVSSNGRTTVAHVGFFGRGYFSSDDIPAVASAILGSITRR